MRVSSQEPAHARPANAQLSTGCAHRDVRLDAPLFSPPTPPAPSLTRGGGRRCRHAGNHHVSR